ncbi:DMT family transporter [Pedobacter sp. SYP-B3415]|uniref:DMT family transporter n=1 Tax=Pedobacter sp. SYP-B3415 TaxID=2496641 RepID=UPI00101C0B1F|nr:DMT family transporter [Pedobacter sp. SYP-B3415]
MKKSEVTGTLSLIFLVIIWGSTFVVTKTIVNDVPPVTFAFLRFLVACLCMLPVFLLKLKTYQIRKLTRREWLLLSLMGLSGVSLYYVIFNLGMQRSSAATAAMIQGSIPVFIALFGALVLKERLNIQQIAGIGLSFTGVIFVALLSGSGNGQNSVAGNLFMFATVFCWAAYTIFSRMLKHLNPFMVTCLSGFIGTAILFVPACFELAQDGARLNFSTSFMFGTLYLGVFSSALGYFLYNKALESLPVAKVGNYLNLDPVIGVLLAITLLNDRISAWQLAGAALVVTGVILTAIRRDPPAGLNK